MIDAAQFTPTARRLVASFPASLATSLRADRNSNDRRARELVRELRRDCLGAGVGLAGAYPHRAMGAAVRFDATKISGCVVDIDPSDPNTRTLTFAGLVAGSDFTSASWAKSAGTTVIGNDTTDPDGTTTADRVTCGSAGVTIRVLQNVTNGTTTSCSRVYTLYVKRNDVDWILIETRNSGAVGDRTWFNINTGTVGTVGANHTVPVIASAGGGWWKITFTCILSGNANFAIYLASGDTLATSPAAGLYLWLWGAAVAETRVSAIVNRVSGVSWTQAVANAQPGLGSLNSVEALRGYGAQNLLSLDPSVVAALVGDDKPLTMLAALRLNVTAAVAAYFGAGSSTHTADYEHSFATSSGARYTMVRSDDATVTGTATSTIATDLLAHVIEWYTGASGQNASFHMDGGTASPSAAAFNVGVTTPDRVSLLAKCRQTISNPINATLGRIVLFSRMLSAVERSYLRVGIGNQYAIAVTP